MDIFVNELTNRLVKRFDECAQNLRSCPANHLARFRQEMNFIEEIRSEMDDVYKMIMEGDEWID